MVEAEQRGRRARPEMAAEHGVEGQQPLQPVVAQMLVDDVGDVHQEHPQEVAHVLLAEPAQRQRRHAERRAVGEARPVERRRSPRQERLEDAGIAQELGAQRRPGRRLGRAGAAEPLAIGAVQRQRRAAGCQRHRGDAAGRAGVEPVALQLERRHHFRVKPVDQMGDRRHPEAGGEFMRAGARRRAPGRPPAASTLRPELAEHRGGDQPVVAAADDDRVK